MDLEGLPHTDTDIEVQPLQFEPISGSKNDQNTDDDSSTVAVKCVITITAMCDCGNCMPMSSRPESKCCHFYAGVREKPLNCITQHEGFSVNFTNIHVLQLALLEFVSLAGPLDDNEPIHKYVPS
ncbi:uncharacterized protein LOC125384481 [Haliotis rufescens]|uniref:uncharacterized protein LOC125384481 n=1 Tax=Haliotis rufescens TaxID=6454 RepID=UPI00201FB2CE|nr:uncharacterized protein LOC125384481 [Haliotis rufescens]